MLAVMSVVGITTPMRTMTMSDITVSISDLDNTRDAAKRGVTVGEVIRKWLAS